MTKMTYRKKEFTNIGSLAILGVSLPDTQYILEITDNSDSQTPLQFSFSNDVTKGTKPYFNTIILKTPQKDGTAAPEGQYMGLLDLAIKELEGFKDTSARVRDIL